MNQGKWDVKQTSEFIVWLQKASSNTRCTNIISASNALALAMMALFDSLLILSVSMCFSSHDGKESISLKKKEKEMKNDNEQKSESR